MKEIQQHHHSKAIEPRGLGIFTSTKLEGYTVRATGLGPVPSGAHVQGGEINFGDGGSVASGRRKP